MVLLPLSGPGGQTGRGAPGQYVYWICMDHPTQETLVAEPGMKIPADFSRESFTELVVWARRRKMMAPHCPALRRPAHNAEVAALSTESAERTCPAYASQLSIV